MAASRTVRSLVGVSRRSPVERPFRTSTFRDSAGQRRSAGANPKPMGASGHTPREPVLDEIGPRAMTSVNSLGFDADHARVRSGPQPRWRRVDVQGAITQASRLLPQGMPTPAGVHQGQPADSRSFIWSSTVDDAPAVDAGRIPKTRIAQRNLAGDGRWRRCRCSGARSTRCTQLESRCVGGSSDRHNEVEAALRNWKT